MSNFNTTAMQLDCTCLLLHSENKLMRVITLPSAEKQTFHFPLLVGLAFQFSQVTKLKLRNRKMGWKERMEWDGKTCNHLLSLDQWLKFPGIKAIRAEFFWFLLTWVEVETYIAASKTRSQAFFPMWSGMSLSQMSTFNLLFYCSLLGLPPQLYLYHYFIES